MSDDAKVELLGTPYDFVRELGRGGMGIVVEARHRARGDLCAVKLIKRDANPEADLVDRMRLEAETLAKVRSVHFVGFLGSGVTLDGSPYYAMERLLGRTLRDELRQRGRLPVEELLAIGIQLFDALAAAHAIGVVHRDVKPENLFLCDGSEPRLVRLLDFGVAKVVEQRSDGPQARAAETALGLMVGSLRWAAPEVVKSEAVDARTDVYSAGLVLFAMASGETPFAHAKTKETLSAAQLREPLPKLTELLRDDDLGALDEILAGATEKARAARTRSARDVGLELRHVLRERYGYDLPPVRQGDVPCLVPASRARPLTMPIGEEPAAERRAPMPRLVDGQRFEHRYEIVSHVGEGGMGTVYRAKHLFMGRDVALKLVPLDEAALAGDLRRHLALETEVLAKIDHPNVVRVFGGGITADGVAYVVMELVLGDSLRARLASERALDDRLALGYLGDVAEGLAVLHAASIIHRDIKPENILVAPGGAAKIVDFGLARVRKHWKHATLRPNPVGTLHYMPREQLLNQPLDESVDVYAFGLVLYECLTGAHPRATLSGAFQNRIEAIASVVEGRPLEPLERRRPDLPEGIVELWRRAVSVDPAKRPKAAELARALRSFAAGSAPAHSIGAEGDATEVAPPPPMSAPVEVGSATLPSSPPNAAPSPPKLAATLRDDAPLPLPPSDATPLARTQPLAIARPSPRASAPTLEQARARRAPAVILGVVVAALVGAVVLELARPGTLFPRATADAEAAPIKLHASRRAAQATAGAATPPAEANEAPRAAPTQDTSGAALAPQPPPVGAPPSPARAAPSSDAPRADPASYR